MDQITKAEVGEDYTLPTGTRVTIQKACEEKNTGFWHCMTHKEGFQNQFQKDMHISKGEHKLAWVCYEHSFEQP